MLMHLHCFAEFPARHQLQSTTYLKKQHICFVSWKWILIRDDLLPIHEVGLYYVSLVKSMAIKENIGKHQLTKTFEQSESIKLWIFEVKKKTDRSIQYILIPYYHRNNLVVVFFIEDVHKDYNLFSFTKCSIYFSD